MYLVLPGRPPSKKNSKRWLRRGTCTFLVPSEKHEAWHEEMALRVRKFRPKKPYQLARVLIAIHPENRRRFDLSNAAESVMDLLVDEGFIADDSAFNVPDLHLVLAPIAAEAKTEVHIHALT